MEVIIENNRVPTETKTAVN